MSQPPFDPSVGYQPNYPASEPPRRPTSVTVLAIIGIILGVFSVICSPIGLIFYFVPIDPPNPLIEATRADPAWFGYTIGSTALGWVIGLLLLIGSIGSLMLKEWARKCMLAYAWIGLVMVPISYAVNLLWLNEKMRAATAGQPGAAISQMLGMILPALGLILPIFILIFMSRPHVKDAFARADANLV
jgi:hypothetical protein